MSDHDLLEQARVEIRECEHLQFQQSYDKLKSLEARLLHQVQDAELLLGMIRGIAGHLMRLSILKECDLETCTTLFHACNNLGYEDITLKCTRVVAYARLCASKGAIPEAIAATTSVLSEMATDAHSDDHSAAMMKETREFLAELEQQKLTPF